MQRLINSITRRLFRPSETLDGYEQRELVDVIFRKTLAYDPSGDWRETAGAASVLDFGGGCGLHYKQANSPDIRWAVVETPAMVARAKELSTDFLQFFTDISAASDWLGSIDVMHSNGALQYTPDPRQTLLDLCALNAKRMLWYRVLLGKSERDIQSSFLSDNGPGRIALEEKIVRYERLRIPERDFLDAHSGYNLFDRGKDWFIYNLR